MDGAGLRAAPRPGGIAGVLGRTRYLQREARDDEERRGCRRFRFVASLTMFVFAFGFLVGAELTGRRAGRS